MIITKLKIGHFGKFKDLELNFGEKLNLIYGPNEAGKTTLLAFIKAMLYGMDSRKRGIRENDRKRFLPWGGEDGTGELYYRDQKDREYQISRRFKETRRGESTAIIDTVTGSSLPGFTGENPGELILNLGEGAFTRTIYIPQLGSTVTVDKEDEIMARLTNLQQTGDEQVSFQKGDLALDEARKQITLRSGNGKLDRLLNQQEALRKEKEQVQVLYKENIEDQWELNRLRDVLSSLQEDIAREERKQQELKKQQQYLELKNLKDRSAEISALEREEKELFQELVCGENPVDQDFLDQVKNLLNDRRQLEEIIADQEDEIKGLSQDLAGLENSLEDFSGFSELESEMEQEVLVKESKKSILAGKLQEVAQIRQEKSKLEQELADKKQEMGHLAVFDDLSGEMEEEILKKEARKNELETLLKNQGDVDLLRRDLIVDKMKNARLIKNTSLVAAIGGFFGGLIRPALLILALAGMVLGLIGYFQQKKLKKDLTEIETRLGQVGNSADLKQEMETLTKELNHIYHMYRVADLQEFTGAKIKYTEKKNQLSILEIKINEREDQLFRADEENLSLEYRKHDNFIKDIYALCGAASLEDFRTKFQEYRRIAGTKDKKLRDLENLKNQQINLIRQMQDKVKNTCHLLDLNGEAAEIIQKAEVILADLAEKLERKNQLTTKIETLRKNYQDLLKGRDWGKLEKSLEGYNGKDLIAAEIVQEEALERRLKELRNERVELEKQIAAITGSMESRFKDCREISRIEEDLASTAQEIRYYRQLLEAIDLAKNMLAESFQELQGSFGPILNQKVGEILSGITGGRYDQVKVDENYQVTIRDQHSGDKVVDYFSNGTLDQVYFALRLGMMELVFGNEVKFPLILDDSFVQYDDRRLEAVLNYLADYAQEHQVLLFTCHQREARLLQGKDFTYLKLADV